MKNYLKLRKLSLMYNYYVYIDTDTYLADQIFIKNKIKVHFLKDMAKNDSEYIVVFCKVKKMDREKFLESLRLLETKMELMGYHDYEEFCKSFVNHFSKKIGRSGDVKMK